MDSERWTAESLRNQRSWDPIPGPSSPKHLYPVLQINGQRVYSPEPAKLSRSQGFKPPKGAEVFVGNLPRNLFENELVPVFAEVGPIHTMRLMMDFSGLTRGFGFVTYFTPQDASEAIRRLDNYEIRPNAFITVHKSVDNCRLFFGNVPRHLTAAEVQRELETILDGIVDVIAYPDSRFPWLNRGFVFVEFETHAMAAIARRKMLAEVMTIWGKMQSKMFVDWAEPEPIVEPHVMAQVKILFIKNLPVWLSSGELKRFMARTVQDISYHVLRTYKRGSYAFIHFKERMWAEIAYEELTREPILFDNSPIEVEWARPAVYSKQNSRPGGLPNNLCTSVPPKTRKQVIMTKSLNIRRIRDKAHAVSASSKVSSCNSSSNYSDSESVNVESSGETCLLSRDLENLAIF